MENYKQNGEDMEKSNKEWVIYVHENLINHKVYVGQTCQFPYNDRWRSGKGYKVGHFKNAIKKYGWENFSSKIIEKNILSREQANKIEKYWIYRYRSILGKDNVYNDHDGGTGMTSEQSKKLSKKNWENPEYRKKFCKPVICINTQKVYESIAEASRQTKIGTKEISLCCRGAFMHNSAGKDENGNPLVWAFYEEGKIYKLPSKTELNKNRKKVICLETQEIFDSMTDAANKIKIMISNISECCNGSRKTAGIKDGIPLHWAFYEEGKEYPIPKIQGATNAIKVRCITTNKIFLSMREAGKYAGVAPNGIGRCCKGLAKTAGQKDGQRLKWEYA